MKTDLYKKETSVAQYLLPSSCHPRHITKNIPYSLAYRLRRICHSDQLFEQRLQELKGDLLGRKYHHKIIDEAFDRVKKILRQEALKKVQKVGNDKRTRLEYHPNLPNTASVVKRH